MTTIDLMSPDGRADAPLACQDEDGSPTPLCPANTMVTTMSIMPGSASGQDDTSSEVMCRSHHYKMRDLRRLESRIEVVALRSWAIKFLIPPVGVPGSNLFCEADITLNTAAKVPRIDRPAIELPAPMSVLPAGHQFPHGQISSANLH